MNAKHTPGPWTVSDSDHIDRCYVTDGNGPGNGPIAKIIRRGAPWSSEAGRKADLANARLIAAAPALLEALEIVELRTTQTRIASRIGKRGSLAVVIFLLGQLESIGADARAAVNAALGE